MKSYSRRELYAAGETLGESVTQRKLGGGYICGGGGSQPTHTTSTVTQSALPEWLKPQTEAMIGSATQQIYNMDSQGNLTSFKPYQPYSTDPSKYVAGFSPLQQQAIQGTANLRTPGQFNFATGLAGQGGIGALGAGSNYAATATNPYATQAYMSPYIENVMEAQKSKAIRDYDIAQQSRKAQAVGQGAFGGSRQAIQEAEAARALQTQLGGIEATGLQSAFDKAQQAQQFGANLGLQGQQAAMQGAGTLGQLGTSQLAAQQGILQAQQQAGQLQQTQEQNILNQAIQNYATAQQYPYQQLSFLNSLIRGYATPTTTVQGYQAAPSAVSQAAGLGTAGIAGLGLYNAMSK